MQKFIENRKNLYYNKPSAYNNGFIEINIRKWSGIHFAACVPGHFCFRYAFALEFCCLLEEIMVY